MCGRVPFVAGCAGGRLARAPPSALAGAAVSTAKRSSADATAALGMAARRAQRDDSQWDSSVIPSGIAILLHRT
jgi:hypothetical protein